MNRYSGAVFVLPLLGTSVYAVLVFGLHWLGGWPGTVDAVTGTTVLTAPLTAVCSAYLALGQHRLRGLTGSTVNAGRVGLRCAAQAWTWATLVFAGVSAVAIGASTSVPHGGSFQPWALLLGPLVLAVGASCGVLAIAAWPHRMMVVLVAPLFFAVSGYAVAPVPVVLRQGPVSGSLAGLELAPSVGAAQVVVLIALAALVLASAELIRVRSTRGAGRVRVAGVVVAAVVVAAAGCVLVRALAADAVDGRFRVSAERATACAGAAPRLCLAPSESRWLGATERAARPALVELAQIGVALPRRYEQQVPGHRPSATSGVASPVDGSSGSPAEAGAAMAVEVADCPAWSDPQGPPPEAAFVARDAVVRWLLVRGGRPVHPSGREERAWLDSADSSEVAGWIRDTLRDLSSCRLDQIRVPWSAPSP